MRRIIGLILVVMVAAMLTEGCSQTTGPQRHDVRGTVTFRGQPVPSGTITFEPDLSLANSGPVSVIPITAGAYDSLELRRPGPLAGPLVVRIAGFPAPDPGVEIQPPLFPEYRTTVDLAAATAVTELNFEVPERARRPKVSRP